VTWLCLVDVVNLDALHILCVLVGIIEGNFLRVGCFDGGIGNVRAGCVGHDFVNLD
jgi:hypothetical protein